MRNRTDSLHGIVDKWFGQAAVCATVMRERAGRQRCVRVEVARGTETLSMRFFPSRGRFMVGVPPCTSRPVYGHAGTADLTRP